MLILLTATQVILTVLIANCVSTAQSATYSNDFTGKYQSVVLGKWTWIPGILVMFVSAELPVGSCDTGANFKEINNGCYFFENTTTATWQVANSTCRGKGARLLALDLLPETIALSFWLKGLFCSQAYVIWSLGSRY